MSLRHKSQIETQSGGILPRGANKISNLILAARLHIQIPFSGAANSALLSQKRAGPRQQERSRACLQHRPCSPSGQP